MERDLATAGVAAPLQIMQSRGGISSAANAARRPVRLFLSGPAAGVVGALSVGKAAGSGDLISIDIGGTSCDIALVSGGEPLVRGEGIIDGYTVRVPMVDVTAIGAGGGSIARIDDAGALRVGPQSAGSEPGPACYGRGGAEPTVDRRLAGARLSRPRLLRRRYAASRPRARPRRDRPARRAHGRRRSRPPRSASTASSTPRWPRRCGWFRSAAASIRAATRWCRWAAPGRCTPPRWPPSSALPAFSSRAHPGVLSAAGLLAAPIEHELSAAYPRPLAGADWAELRAVLARLDGGCAGLMRGEGVTPDAAVIRHFADICYIGQGYHLEIPIRADASEPLAALYRDFLAAHDRVYGHATEAPARIVNLRALHRVAPPASATARPMLRVAPSERKSRRQVLIDPSSGVETADIYDRAALAVGREFAGPAIVEQPDTTTLVPRGWRCRVAAGEILLLEPVTGR